MNNIINFLILENEMLCNILTIPLTCIEFFAMCYVVKTIYNLAITKRQIIYFSLLGSIAGGIRLILPMPYNFVLNAIFAILGLKYILKLSITKSIISLSVSLLLTAVFEYLVTMILAKVFFMDLYESSNIPMVRISLSLFIYLNNIVVVTIFSYLKTNLNISDNMNQKNKMNIIINSLLIVLIVCPSLIYLLLLDMEISTSYILYNILCALALFLLNTYNTYKFNKLDITTRELETAKLYNTTLNKLVDANRGFRHNINNMIQAIEGYIEFNDMEGLKTYYKTGLLLEVHKINNLSILNPDVINSAPIFGLFLAKYNYAEEENVKIELTSFFDYTTIKVDIFKFTKILGILLDNAIEAAKVCEDKIVSIYVSIDFYNRKQIFKISNTYVNKDVDIKQIYKKDYSTKEKPSGFGLWEVQQMLKKDNNIVLATFKTKDLFTQKLELSF